MTERSDQLPLDFDANAAQGAALSRDEDARRRAVDPSANVALEASAGTGKTRVLVDRYVGLLAAGVEPRHILAITFTRKAAAEMRQRILETLAARYEAGAFTRERWRQIRDRLGDIAISTIDAFCLSLLKEFPLEADIDPDFELADETEAPRLVDLALDRTLRIGRGLAVHDEDMALLFADLGESRLRDGLARLLDRRLVAASALARFVSGPHVGVETAVTRLVADIRSAVDGLPGGASRFVASGPDADDYAAFARDLEWLLAVDGPAADVQAHLGRVRTYVLTQKGEPRRRLEHRKALFRSAADYERHKAGVMALGAALAPLLERYEHDVNRVLAGAVRRLFAIARDAYADVLREQNVLDFPDVLARALDLLGRMDEFSRSRFRLESRYQHVLVDEFQDTSRAQWQLVELLVRSWGEGEGLSSGPFPPSIFIVGDRKQSIYAFRDAEVQVLDSAARYIQALRPGGSVRHAITRSYRSVRELLAFVNDCFAEVEKQPARDDAFRYGEDDRFPLSGIDPGRGEAVGIVGGASDEAQAEAVAEEIARLILDEAVVRDRQTGVRRAVRAGDIAVLFRTRDSHRLFEKALARRRVPFYVYKGLGFFDADEIKDVLALLAFLASPDSNLRAAAMARSRFIGLSDPALTALAPDVAAALTSGEPPPAIDLLADDDRRRLALARAGLSGWLPLVDRLPPAELLDRILAESAYMVEAAGPGMSQARENLKKIRGIVRRLQNRGYQTLPRIVDHFSRRTAGGDESNAIVDAEDAVSLMTVHAAKGLEFPVVVLAGLQRGSGGTLDPIRVVPARPTADGDESEPFVAVGERQGDADRDAEAREVEETKRLLYVACTRARDRLYLAATLDDAGRFAPAKGSLGRVLPPSLTALFAPRTDDLGPRLVWTGPTAQHDVRVVPPAGDVASRLPDVAPPAPASDDFAPLAVDARRRGVTAEAGTSTVSDSGDAGTIVEPSSPLAGTLVHRALEARVGLDEGVWPESRIVEALDALLTADERASRDAAAAVDRAARAYPRLIGNAELRMLFSTGRVEHEVPLSFRQDGRLVRGVVDCLVDTGPDGPIVIVEIKTGRASASDAVQVATYGEAVRALAPGRRVEERLFYLHNT